MSKGDAYIPGTAAHISQDPTNRLGRKRTRAQTSGSQVVSSQPVRPNREDLVSCGSLDLTTGLRILVVSRAGRSRTQNIAHEMDTERKG